MAAKKPAPKKGAAKKPAPKKAQPKQTTQPAKPSPRSRARKDQTRPGPLGPLNGSGSGPMQSPPQSGGGIGMGGYGM